MLVALTSPSTWPAGNSQSTLCTASRSCRIKMNFPSTVRGATTAAVWRWATIHETPSGRVGVAMRWRSTRK